jgi:orotidine-5'-phosphate decarboxylase
VTKLVIALDESTADRALEVVRATSPMAAWYKVGYEAYYGYGDRVVSALRSSGKSMFLDLKLHDIPNTVAAGVRAAAVLGARLLTIHTAGGAEMMSAAAAARDEMDTDMRLLGITVLTSMGEADLREVGVDRSPADLVSMRVQLAARCGLDGVVCAVSEASSARQAAGRDFMIVCPGIRPAGAGADDQRRVATPADAVHAGADFIVVGRPITKAADPAAAAAAILQELKNAS